MIDSYFLDSLADNLAKLNEEELKALQDSLRTRYDMNIELKAVVQGGVSAVHPQGGIRYDVVLTKVGGAKLQLVKTIKELTGVGLKEAKEMVDNYPTTILHDMYMDEINNHRLGNVVDLIEATGSELKFEAND